MTLKRANLTEALHDPNRAIAHDTNEKLIVNSYFKSIGVEFYIHSMPWTISFQKNQNLVLYSNSEVTEVPLYTAVIASIILCD